MVKNKQAMNKALIAKPASVSGYSMPITMKKRLVAVIRRRKMLTGMREGKERTSWYKRNDGPEV
jgi:hypothetical protein